VRGTLVAMTSATAPGRSLLAHDRAIGVSRVAGADEAGRGCLAGPLVASAVCLDVRADMDLRLEELDDSKRLTSERREVLFEAVMECAEQVAVVVVPAEEIDRRGLHRSNLWALERALLALDPAPEVCLTDGFRLPEAALEHRAVVGGDRTSAAVAAASIIAKVTRDRFMRRAAGDYPQYGFEHHVGYITEIHSGAVRVHGLTPLHRRSFQAAAYAELDLGR
jgi:ribonuclease HII